MTFEEVKTFISTPIGNSAACVDCHKVATTCMPYVFANDDTLYERLTTGVIERCDGRTLVVPFEPENSALYLALEGTCGEVNKMPAGCFESDDGFENTCSPLEDRERLRLWIEAGAPVQ